MAKPPLGPINVGDTVLVIQPRMRRAGNELAPIPATVTKSARVWIDLQETDTDGRARTWRMRLDTQDDGGDGRWATRFATPEQLAWQQRITAANSYLRDAGIKVDFDSRWSGEDATILLANLLRAHDGLPKI